MVAMVWVLLKCLENCARSVAREFVLSPFLKFQLTSTTTTREFQYDCIHLDCET